MWDWIESCLYRLKFWLKFCLAGILLFIIMVYCVAVLYMENGGISDTSDSRPVPVAINTTELNAVGKIFPGLNGAVSAQVEQLKYGGSSSRDALPSPVDYQYRGYITLSEEAAARYAEEFSFADAEPEVSFEIIKKQTGHHWKYSDEFEQTIIRNGFVGDVWLDGDTILFSVGTT